MLHQRITPEVGGCGGDGQANTLIGLGGNDLLEGRGGVDMPIAEHVAAVVHDGMAPRDMVHSLMTRVAKPEWEGE